MKKPRWLTERVWLGQEGVARKAAAEHAELLGPLTKRRPNTLVALLKTPEWKGSSCAESETPAPPWREIGVCFSPVKVRGTNGRAFDVERSPKVLGPANLIVGRWIEITHPSGATARLNLDVLEAGQ